MSIITRPKPELSADCLEIIYWLKKGGYVKMMGDKVRIMDQFHNPRFSIGRKKFDEQMIQPGIVCRSQINGLPVWKLP